MTAMPGQGPTIAILPDGLEIPPGITDMARFRSWARSASFPDRGRLDWVAGRLEVDMTPEDLSTHASPKSAIAAALVNLVQDTELGLVCVDSTRISSAEADLSAEPDVLVLLVETIERGEARLVPSASGKKDRWIEIEGSADIVVEVVSDSSEVKDRKRLRALYHAAGMKEYWLVDARSEKATLEVLIRKEADYAGARTDKDGFARSEVLNRGVRLIRGRRAAGLSFFRLEVGP